MDDITELAKMRAIQLNNDQKQLLGFNSSQIFRCTFSGRPCDMTNDFRSYYSYSRGNCFTYNSGLTQNNTPTPLKTIELDGQQYGLSLIIAPLLNSNKYPTSYSNGLKVYIHNQTFQASSSDGFYLEPGKETTIAVRKTITNNYPAPYSECTDLSSSATSKSSQLYTYIVLTKNKTYRQYDCFNLCLQRAIEMSCGCFWARYDHIDNETFQCFNLTHLECIKKEQAEFNELICIDECPLECDSTTYSLQASMLEFPSRQMYDVFKREVTLANYSYTYEMYKESVLALNIFYPYAQYTRITESPKTTPIDLLSQIGGSLGMCVGFSLFHAIEVGEILFLMAYISLKK